MASKPPAACCASGFKHEGTPIGEIKEINGGKCGQLQLESFQLIKYSQHLHCLPQGQQEPR